MLYNVVLLDIELHHTILYYTVLHDMSIRYVVLYCNVLYNKMKKNKEHI